jgi:magnesium chelatase family protein
MALDVDDYRPFERKVVPGGLGDHVLIMGARGAKATLWAREQRQRIPHAERSECATDADYLYRCAGLGLGGAEPIDILQEGTGPVPFRAPHHSVSLAGLTGRLENGWRLKPGELLLAHGGVFFVDDATEFRTDVLAFIASIARLGRVRLGFNVPDEGQSSILVPTRFRLIAFATMCPCGRSGGRSAGECQCTARAVELHVAKLAPLQSVCRLVGAEVWQAEAKAIARRLDA